jgi:seryl-tRNA synthetase
MHDSKRIRYHPADFDLAMHRRGLPPVSPDFLKEIEILRELLSIKQETETKRNALANEIRLAKRAGTDTKDLELKGVELRQKLESVEKQTTASVFSVDQIIRVLPNELDADVPAGRDESDNLEKKRSGSIRNFSFAPKQHFELGEKLGLMDFSAAAKIAGSRFTVLRGALAKMERALGQFMLDVHTDEHGYQETAVPLLVNDAAMFGTGQLPKFADDLFKTTDGRWLIPTAEVSLTNLVAGEILPLQKLPLRFAALTPCFRSEAGSAGRDVRGMLRQHQFQKCEMVSVTHPDESDAEHERMTRCAEIILEKLELPYRKMLLCAGDTGFSAAKTYDLEVWLPGQGMYREISSCSKTCAFQARRMNARYREADGKTIGFVHTLNGSGVAVGRALIAVLENYQNADGTVNVPEILRPYMGGLDVIAAA